MNNLWQDIVNFINNNGLKIIGFVLTFLFGILIIKILNRWIKKIFVRRHIDGIVANFTTSLLYIIFVILLIITLFGMLDISLAPFVTVIGTIGLALSLSLQNSLSNIASGMVILITKPFKQEDYVSIGDLEGNIKKINFFTTELHTFDNKRIIIPNNKVVSSDIVNFSSLETRRMDIDFKTPFGVSVEDVKKVFDKIFSENENILKIPMPKLRLIENTQSTLTFSARIWVKTQLYWDVFFDIHEKMYNELKDNGILKPENKLDINIIGK
jgi:small conductance mechanosensitive channel